MAFQTEMYTPVGTSIVMQQPVHVANGLVTWWDLLMNAARIKFGGDMQLHNTHSVKSALARFVESMLFTVVQSDPEPLMERPTIVDVTLKEFINHGERENDETTFQLGKNSPIAAGPKYMFFMKGGVKFDHKYNLGSQIVGLSMAGGFQTVGSILPTTEQSYNSSVQFFYNQKEKIVIPPKTKVKAKIITSTRRFRQNYTLEFSASRSSSILVEYFTNTQLQYNCCNCIQPTIGYVYAGDIMRTLANFRETADGYCCYNQNGTLTWIGEVCSVEKTEVPTQLVDVN